MSTGKCIRKPMEWFIRDNHSDFGSDENDKNRWACFSHKNIEGHPIRVVEAGEFDKLLAQLAKAEKALQMLIDDSFDSQESRDLARQTLTEIRKSDEPR